MNWSAQSPDLNPIENLWRIIKIRISARRHQIHSIEAMKKAILKKWETLTKKDFRKCIESMPKRCQLVIKAKKSSIKYWLYSSYLAIEYASSMKICSHWKASLSGGVVEKTVD